MSGGEGAPKSPARVARPSFSLSGEGGRWAARRFASSLSALALEPFGRGGEEGESDALSRALAWVSAGRDRGSRGRGRLARL